jgi:hypothetical protein
MYNPLLPILQLQTLFKLKRFAVHSLIFTLFFASSLLCKGQNRLTIASEMYSTNIFRPAVMEMADENILVVGLHENKIIVTILDTNLCLKSSVTYGCFALLYLQTPLAISVPPQ